MYIAYPCTGNFTELAETSALHCKLESYRVFKVSPVFISSSAFCLPWRELAWDAVGLGRGTGAALCPWAGSALPCPEAAVGALAWCPSQG